MVEKNLKNVNISPRTTHEILFFLIQFVPICPVPSICYVKKVNWFLLCSPIKWHLEENILHANWTKICQRWAFICLHCRKIITINNNSVFWSWQGWGWVLLSGSQQTLFIQVGRHGDEYTWVGVSKAETMTRTQKPSFPHPHKAAFITWRCTHSCSSPRPFILQIL